MSNVGDDGDGGKLSPDSEEVRLVKDLARRYYLLRCEGKLCPCHWTRGQGQLRHGDVFFWLCLWGRTAQHGPRNVGWFLGGIKSDDGQAYCAIDVDFRHGGAETYDTLVRELGPLPDTVRDVREEGGPHIYCTMPVDLLGTGDNQRSRVVIGDGVEFMCNHAQILIPPSIGSGGHCRRWVVRPRLSGEPWNFAALPPSWCEFVQSRVRKPLPPPPASPPGSPRPPGVPPSEPAYRRRTVDKNSLEWMRMSGEDRAQIDPENIALRIRAFLESMSPTPGTNLHTLKFQVACRLRHGFDCTDAEALAYLVWWGRLFKPPPDEKFFRDLLDNVPPEDRSGRPLGYLLGRNRPNPKRPGREGEG
jgi:hypothetical protein